MGSRVMSDTKSSNSSLILSPVESPPHTQQAPPTGYAVWSWGVVVVVGVAVGVVVVVWSWGVVVVVGVVVGVVVVVWRSLR